jgi:hypothetical protein
VTFALAFEARVAVGIQHPPKTAHATNWSSQAGHTGTQNFIHAVLKALFDLRGPTASHSIDFVVERRSCSTLVGQPPEQRRGREPYVATLPLLSRSPSGTRSGGSRRMSGWAREHQRLAGSCRVVRTNAHPRHGAEGGPKAG